MFRGTVLVVVGKWGEGEGSSSGVMWCVCVGEGYLGSTVVWVYGGGFWEGVVCCVCWV